MKKIFIAAVAAFASLALLSSCGDKNAVDLGLSVKWHQCNLGAAAPGQGGGWYAWGALEEQERYSKSDYVFYTEDGFTKYNEADGLEKLQAADDVVKVKLGKKWRMPTMAEVEELVDNCEREWIEVDGVDCLKFTAKNGKSIIFPGVGDKFSSFEPHPGKVVRVWTSELQKGDPDTGIHLYCTERTASPDAHAARYIGYQIRPVCD